MRGWTAEGWLPGEKMNAQLFVARHETTTSSRSVHVEQSPGLKNSIPLNAEQSTNAANQGGTRFHKLKMVG